MIIKIPVSIGELADKITILEIKKVKIRDKKKLTNIGRELKYLRNLLNKLNINSKVKKEMLTLKKINVKLWKIEDMKRKAEKKQIFDELFIKNARNVYIYNDLRAKIKHNINKLTGSEIIEEKSYSKY